MEQAVTWTEDTWNSADDDLWYGTDESDAEAFHRARDAAILKHKGVVLSTCWVPFKGIVATVRCSDGEIRTASVDRLKSVEDADQP